MNNSRKSLSWWETDVCEKERILESLWRGAREITPQKKQLLLEYLESCSNAWHEAKEIKKIIEQAVSEKIDLDIFKKYFSWLSPFDAKMIDFNHGLGVKKWEESEVAATRLDNAHREKLKQYLKESGASVSVCIGNVNANSDPLVAGKQDPYAIHSIGKIFTGLLALRLVEEKPDGETSILPEVLLNERMQINPDALKMLPEGIKRHLEENTITLFQLMTHMSGMGDYGYDRETGSYRRRIESGERPSINGVRDFLPFAEDKIYQDIPMYGKYSNLGFVLVGLALEHAYDVYRDAHPALNLPAYDFNGLLSHYITQEAGMTCFAANRPENGRFNPTDKAAEHMVGSPAGGYWSSTEDLGKFSKWLHLHCQHKEFKSLMIKYGKEFYDSTRDVIHHPGSSESASSFFALSLKTGNFSIVLSDQPGIAHAVGLEFLLGDRVFKPSTQLTSPAFIAQSLSPSRDTLLDAPQIKATPGVMGNQAVKGVASQTQGVDKEGAQKSDESKKETPLIPQQESRATHNTPFSTILTSSKVKK